MSFKKNRISSKLIHESNAILTYRVSKRFSNSISNFSIVDSITSSCQNRDERNNYSLTQKHHRIQKLNPLCTSSLQSMVDFYSIFFRSSKRGFEYQLNRRGNPLNTNDYFNWFVMEQIADLKFNDWKIAAWWFKLDYDPSSSILLAERCARLWQHQHRVDSQCSSFLLWNGRKHGISGNLKFLRFQNFHSSNEDDSYAKYSYSSLVGLFLLSSTEIEQLYGFLFIFQHLSPRFTSI